MGSQRKFFFTQDMGNNLFGDIWSYGVTQKLRGYTDDAGADYYIVSSNSGDGQDISIVCQDEEKNEFTIGVTLDGQTPVLVNNLNNTFLGFNKRTTPFKLTEGYRMTNENGIPFSGTITLTEGSNFTAGVPNDPTAVRAEIPFLSLGGTNISSNKTLMSQYRIPSKTWGFFYTGYASILRPQAGSADFSLWSRDVGGVFTMQSSFDRNTQGTTDGAREFMIPEIISPSTDLVLRGVASAASIGASGMYIILLMDEEFVLRAVEQMIENGLEY